MWVIKSGKSREKVKNFILGRVWEHWVMFLCFVEGSLIIYDNNLRGTLNFMITDAINIPPSTLVYTLNLA